MRPLSVPELLAVWERGLAAHPCERALEILAAASPESASAALADVSIGRRDAALLMLREWAFGSELAVLANCPRCHEPLETLLRTSDLRASEIAHADEASSMIAGRYAMRCRPPTTSDLLASCADDASVIRRSLLARCVIDAAHDGVPLSPDELPAEIASAVIDRIAAIDPQADTRIRLICPDCHHEWEEVFDIASFFWAEIDAWARRLLRDVTVLARAFGWREHDILGLSPARRQIYLAMAQA
jgi:hypothetical protein